MTIAAAFAAFAGFLSRLADWMLGRQRAAALSQSRADGANAADLATLKTLTEIAHDQSDNSSPAADGVHAVADRLRARHKPAADA